MKKWVLGQTGDHGWRYCFTTSSFAVLLNGGLSSFFKASRGLRKGDTLSLLLFIIIMEVLNKLLLKARELHLFKGMKVDMQGEEVEITRLFFVDDTLLLCELDLLHS